MTNEERKRIKKIVEDHEGFADETRAAIAGRMGTDAQHFSKLMTGREPWTVGMLMRFASAFKVDALKILLDGVERELVKQRNKTKRARAR